MDFASKWDNIGKPLHMLQEAKCTSVLIVLGPISPEQKRTQMRKRICSDGFFFCAQWNANTWYFRTEQKQKETNIIYIFLNNFDI